MQKQICVIFIRSSRERDSARNEIGLGDELFELREPGSSDELWRGQAELHECKVEDLSTSDPDPE